MAGRELLLPQSLKAETGELCPSPLLTTPLPRELQDCCQMFGGTPNTALEGTLWRLSVGLKGS